MRIAIDATSAFKRGGGVPHYTRELIAALAEVDSKNDYFLYSLDSKNEENIPLGGHENFRICQTKKFIRNISFWRNKIDLFHGPNFKVFGPAGKKNIITIHDLGFMKYEIIKPRAKKRLIGKIKEICQRGYPIIAMSQSTAKDIRENFSVREENIRVIYAGVSPRFVREKDRDLVRTILKKYGIGEKYLLFIGNLEPRKNLSTLLKSFAEFQKKYPDYLLVLAGKGWHFDQKIGEIMEKENLKNKVIITGYVAAEDIPILYSGAELLAFPSLYEGFGMPLLEAMACGCPVITSNRSSLPEVAGEAGILIDDPLDSQELLRGIIKIADGPDLRKLLVEKGYAQYKKFTWERTARETLKFYEEVFGS